MSIDRSIAPKVRPFEKIALPEEQTEKLSNGITMHYLNGGDQPVCRLSVALPGGTCETGSDCVANLSVSQLIEGTTTLNASEIADKLDFNGVRVGCRTAAHQSLIEFSMLSHKSDRILPIIDDILMHPVFPESELSTAKLRLSSAMMAARRDISTIASEEFTHLIHGAENPLGIPLSQEMIDSVSPSLLKETHIRQMSPDGMHVFLSGALREDLIGQTKEIFECIRPADSPFGYRHYPLNSATPGTRQIERPDSFQSAIVAGLPTVGRTHPDYIPLRLTIMALGGYFGSRLMQNIREEKGLTYGIYASLFGVGDNAYMQIAAQCDCSYTHRVTEEIDNEIKRLISDPPFGDELERLRLYASTSLAETLDTPSSVMGYYMSRLIAEIPDGYFEAQLEAISRLDSDTISTMASRYLTPERLITVIAGKK